jgi:hypothetical protein
MQNVAGSSSSATMVPPVAAVVDGAAEARWVAWRARGAASDRQSGRVMGWVLAIVVMLIVGVLVAQLR